jgi:hypothetical protein
MWTHGNRAAGRRRNNAPLVRDLEFELVSAGAVESVPGAHDAAVSLLVAFALLLRDLVKGMEQ